MKRIALLPLVLLSGFGCMGSNDVVKKPKTGHPTEFHRKAEKILPHFYTSVNNRGVDRRDDVSYFESLGLGAGVYVNQDLNWQWTGHKFLYYYADIEAQPEKNWRDSAYPGKTNWVIGTNPGIRFRSYLPFWMKVYYGGGMTMKLSPTQYDPWGLYLTSGLQFYGFTAGATFIGHPGQSNWEREYQFGYIIAPTE